MALILSLLKSIAPFAPVFGLEWYLNQYAAANTGSLVARFLAPHSTLGVPRAFGLVALTNIIGASLVVVGLGFRVGAAREKYNVPLPSLYGNKDTEEHKKFNCVQRSHQQTFETFTQFISLSVLGGLTLPISTSVFGALWCYARMKWAEGYALGDPKKRYSHSAWGKHIWTGLLGVLFTSLYTAYSFAEL